MKFDFSKLEGRIIEKFGKRYAFAKAAGYTNAKLSSRLNSKSQWTLEEMYLIIQPHLLDIPPDEIPQYFFKPKFD